MKLTETIERITIKMQQKTIDLQKKQIKTHKEQVKRHERLMKALMQELGYPSWKISATILANYKDHDEGNISTKK
jgi:Holliday junction resolvasome RuvABC DNA-binding subunit